MICNVAGTPLTLADAISRSLEPWNLSVTYFQSFAIVFSFLGVDAYMHKYGQKSHFDREVMSIVPVKAKTIFVFPSKYICFQVC